MSPVPTTITDTVRERAISVAAAQEEKLHNIFEATKASLALGYGISPDLVTFSGKNDWPTSGVKFYTKVVAHFDTNDFAIPARDQKGFQVMLRRRRPFSRPLTPQGLLAVLNG
jgi:hypothetical protein